MKYFRLYIGVNISNTWNLFDWCVNIIHYSVNWKVFIKGDEYDKFSIFSLWLFIYVCKFITVVNVRYKNLHLEIIKR